VISGQTESEDQVTGNIIVRTVTDGSKRYDADYRAVDVESGKIVQKRKTFTKRKAAEAFLAATVVSVNNGAWQDVSPQLMTVVFDRWDAESLTMRLKQQDVKPSTARSYRSMVREHFVPSFGAIRSDRLRAPVLEAWARARADEIGEGTLAAKTYTNLLNLLHAILKWARSQDYLGAHDPLAELKRLPGTQIERAFLEVDHIPELLTAADDIRDSTVVALAVYSGLRRGELFGLQWGDIDWSGRIAVRRSWCQGELTSPKSKRSRRQVDVPASLLMTLAIYKAYYPPLPGDFVFRTEAGAALDSDNFHKRVMVPMLGRVADLPPINGLHGLRHTYASLLINQGASLKYVSAQLGHASIALTADLYSHIFKETGTAEMLKLDARIGTTRRPVVVTGTFGR
jgi:integrase